VDYTKRIKDLLLVFEHIRFPQCSASSDHPRLSLCRYRPVRKVFSHCPVYKAPPLPHRFSPCSGRCSVRTLSLTAAPDSSTSLHSTCRFVKTTEPLTIYFLFTRSECFEIVQTMRMALPCRWGSPSCSAAEEPPWLWTPRCPSHTRRCGPWSP